MREVEAWETFDGKLFDNEHDAAEHERDKIAEELDSLFSHVMHLEVSHRAMVSGILNAVEKDRAGLRKIVNTLYNYLN